MLLMCVVEVLSWQSDVSKPCAIPRSLQTLFLFLQDHSVKLKGVCAVYVLAVCENAVAGMYSSHVNPYTTSDEVICCASVCLINGEDLTLVGSVSQKNRLLGSLSSLCLHPLLVSRRSRHAHTIASSTPPSSVEIAPLPPQTSPFSLDHFPSCPLPQQPGSPLQSVPTSPTACSSACAPSSRLAR